MPANRALEQLPCYDSIFKARLALKAGKPLPAERQTSPVKSQTAHIHQDFFSFGELAHRWRCSRGTVYNRLRLVNAKVLDFSPRGRRSRKAVSLKTVLEIENRLSKPLR